MQVRAALPPPLPLTLQCKVLLLELVKLLLRCDQVIARQGAKDSPGKQVLGAKLEQLAGHGIHAALCVRLTGARIVRGVQHGAQARHILLGLGGCAGAVLCAEQVAGLAIVLNGLREGVLVLKDLGHLVVQLGSLRQAPSVHHAGQRLALQQLRGLVWVAGLDQHAGSIREALSGLQLILGLLKALCSAPVGLGSLSPCSSSSSSKGGRRGW